MAAWSGNYWSFQLNYILGGLLWKKQEKKKQTTFINVLLLWEKAVISDVLSMGGLDESAPYIGLNMSLTFKIISQELILCVETAKKSDNNAQTSLVSNLSLWTKVAFDS